MVGVGAAEKHFCSPHAWLFMAIDAAGSSGAMLKHPAKHLRFRQIHSWCLDVFNSHEDKNQTSTFLFRPVQSLWFSHYQSSDCADTTFWFNNRSLVVCCFPLLGWGCFQKDGAPAAHLILVLLPWMEECVWRRSALFWWRKGQEGVYRAFKKQTGAVMNLVNRRDLEFFVRHLRWRNPL